MDEGGTLRNVACGLAAALTVSCAVASPRAGPPAAGGCPAISDQERWGFVVGNPAARGFRKASETEHFLIWTAPGASANPGAVETGEAHVRRMEQHFGRAFDAKVDLFVYPDPQAVRAATGMDVMIRRDAMQLHISSSRHLHEVVHLMTYRWTGHRTVPLLEEGVAEAYGSWSWRGSDPVEKLAIKDWSGEHVDRMTARWLAAGVVPSLETVAANGAFRGYAGPTQGQTYVFAASFVLSLVRDFGAGKVLELMRATCLEDGAETVSARMQAALGAPLPELERRWRRRVAEAERTVARERGDTALAKALDGVL